ncbi:MAG: hypothetical protein AAGC47_00100 [Bacteroidota bacterium]
MAYGDTLNRGAISIVPKQAYHDWANAALPEEEPTRPSEGDEATVYLVEGNWNNIDEPLQKHWEDIFANELFLTTSNEDLWPDEIDLEMFKEWFSYSIGSILIDLEDGELGSED